MKQKKKETATVQYIYQSQINGDGKETVWGKELRNWLIKTYLLCPRQSGNTPDVVRENKGISFLKLDVNHILHQWCDILHSCLLLNSANWSMEFATVECKPKCWLFISRCGIFYVICMWYLHYMRNILLNVVCVSQSGWLHLHLLCS